jgi:hypothetical protein
MRPLLLMLFLFGCATAPPPLSSGTAVAEKLHTFLIGTFDSSAQASAQAQDFRPIVLTICPVAAPELGPRVLYVEQAVQSTVDKPYRQRLYVVEPGQDAATAVSRVLELKTPSAAIGLCSQPQRPAFSASDVEEKRGCAVTLKWNGKEFVGATQGTECPSTLRGARYATSEVTLTESRLISWDRGYDTSGNQVWGSEKGPYVFVRQGPPMAPASRSQ